MNNRLYFVQKYTFVFKPYPQTRSLVGGRGYSLIICTDWKNKHFSTAFMLLLYSTGCIISELF